MALLTLPPAIALARFKRFGSAITAAILLNLVAISLGLWLSYVLDFPAGPSIILVAAAVYLTSVLRPVRG